ncbi:hypothetical protein [Limosilactobacillus reuteri]|nr:hypothetical protein [Limosilactobacillus reuteri]
MTKLINSRIVALLTGLWIAYCLGVKAYDGAIVLLAVYLFSLHELNKTTN